eukprot:1158086-Pelagomonas_calceolata.AAC.10
MHASDVIVSGLGREAMLVPLSAITSRMGAAANRSAWIPGRRLNCHLLVITLYWLPLMTHSSLLSSCCRLNARLLLHECECITNAAACAVGSTKCQGHALPPLGLGNHRGRATGRGIKGRCSE